MAGDNLNRLYTLGLRKKGEEPEQKGIFLPGLEAGARDLQSLGGAALQGTGIILGSQGLAETGKGISDRASAASAAAGRADLEVAPWQEGGANVLPWLGYQASKQLPILATYMLGGKAYQAAGGPVSGELSRLGAQAPRVLGGGGLKAGATFAERRAAAEAGKDFAGSLTGGAVAGMPIAFGSMVQEADQKEGGATLDDVQKAAALSPVYSALDALQPAQLKALLTRGSAGGLVKRVATASLVGAAGEIPQEGLQTALEMSFRPDISTKDKLSNIVDAAVTGGAIGGLFGGVGGVRAMKRIDPTQVETADVKDIVDQALGLLPAPTTFVNSQGQAAYGSDGMDRVRNAFAEPGEPAPTGLPGPQDIEGRSTIDGSTIIVGRRGPNGRFTSEATGVEQPPVVPDDTARAFRNLTDPELFAASNALANKQQASGLSPEQLEIAKGIETELAFRRNGSLTNNAPSGPAEAVQLETPTAGDGGTTSDAPVSATQSSADAASLPDLLKGVSTRKSYADVTNVDDLRTKVTARLEAGSSAKGDFVLAQRLGIDPNATGAPVEAKAPIAEEPAQSAPTLALRSKADPEFVAQWKGDIQKVGQRDKGARALKPGTLQEAQVQLYQALGKDQEIGDGLERLAQKYGILDEQKRLTPLAAQIAAKEPIPNQEVRKAAAAQGFQGMTREAFAAGVQAALGGAQKTDFTNQADFEAYSAGSKFAEERNSVPKGALKRYDPKAYTGDVTDAQVAQANGAAAPTPEARVVPEEVKQVATANRAIDGTAAAFGVGDNIATLKRLARTDPEAALEALNRVQNGQDLFSQPEAKPVDFKGEKLTRGAPKAGRVGSVTLGPTRGQSRAQAEIAIRKFQLTRAIRGAFEEGAIDNRTRIKLLAQLNAGNVAAVQAAIPTQFSGEKALRETSLADATARREALRERLEALDQEEAQDDVPELTVDRNGVLRAARFMGEVRQSEAERVQEMLDGKTPLQVIDVLQKEAPTGYHREVAIAMRRAMQTLMRAGMKFEFKIAKAGDMVPEELATARGLAYDDAGLNVTTVWINGTDFPERSGLTYEVIMHEMLHAVTMQSISVVETNQAELGETKLGKAVQDLQAVTDAIKAHFMNRQRQGNLTPLEKWVLESNALDNTDEILAWSLSSPQFQSYIDTIDYTPRQTLWGRFVQAMRVFMGLGARGDGALVEVLRASEEIMALGPAEFELEALRQGGKQMMRSPGAAPAANEKTTGLAAKLEQLVPRESATAGTRKMVFGWNTIGHLATHYAKKFPELMAYSKVHLERRAIAARWSQLFEKPYADYEKLAREDRKAADTLTYLMSLTQFQIDPTRPWESHEHLQNAPNAARLKELTEDANRKYNLLRGKGHARIYDDFRATNEASHLGMMSVSLHNLVVSDPTLAREIGGFEIDPVDAFRERPALHESAQNALGYWGDTLDAQVKAAEAYIQRLRGDTTGSPAEQRAASTRLEPIEARLRSIRESRSIMRNAPYFHLGRHGEHFVAFTLRVGDNKVVDQAAIDEAGKRIEAAGFKNIEISRDQTNPKVYIRVETIEARKQLEQIAKDLERDGYLKPDSKILAAPRSDGKDFGTADAAPAWLDQYIQSIKASPIFEPREGMTADERAELEARKAQMVSQARELWLDMLPDTAIAKVMVHRNSVPGFDRDMVRNFAFRFQVGVNSLANLSASAKLNNVFADMRGRVNEAQTVGAPQHGDVDLLRTLMTEVQIREAQRPMVEAPDWLNTFRAINHAYFLGFSPSYVLVNTTQLGVLLWPELAKKHGFAKSAKAIAAVTGTAFRIMSETLKAGAAVGPKRALDAVITEDVLKKVTDEKTANFLMRVIADGIIDIGGSSRELGRVASGGIDEKLDTGLRWAASFGLYSETFARLVAALSVRQLSGDDLPYAHQVIEQSMLNYSDWNTGRQLGNLGFAGKYTKIMTAFMQYNAQVLEKLYREFHAGIISKTSTPEEKQQARRFIAGHLTAVTAVAGTLGLPFATVAASVIEKIVDLIDDDDKPYDATAAWRNFLADLLGPAVGEVVARGAPRAAGFDLSQRAGEQNLIPFSQFLTDKRKWRESAADAALRSQGAPVSMLLNILEGGEKFGNGDVMGGLTSAMPMAIKGPAQAFRMTEDGYVDTKGNRLPLTPKAQAVLLQIVGLTPADKAEYSEARGDQAAREGVLQARGQVLRKQIVDAVIDGDQEGARELIERAQAFDKANPTFAVLPDIEKSVDRRIKAQAIAISTRTPIGTKPEDIDGRALTGYANIEFAPQ